MYNIKIEKVFYIFFFVDIFVWLWVCQNIELLKIKCKILLKYITVK